MKRISLISLLSFFGTLAFGQVQVDYNTAQQAVDQLLGDGVNAFNIEFTGSAAQLGLLYGANDIIFSPDSGVIISTSDVTNIATGMDNNVPFGQGVNGDPDLLTIANSVAPLIGYDFVITDVEDVASLEFDFVPIGTTVSFNYSFGSDEYLAWLNSAFNDVFAFFLSGPGIAGPFDAPVAFPDGAINIAFVPESDPELPITISSVNDELNTQYYIDNPQNEDVSINGYTAVFTAFADVVCGEVYHIKLAIADGTDNTLESIVVLEAGSFTSNAVLEVNIPDAPAGLEEATLIEGCLEGILTFKRACTESEADTLDLIIAGDAIMNSDYVPFLTEIAFPAGVFEIQIPIIPLLDDEVEDTEEIIIINIDEDSGDTTQVTFFIIDYQLPSFDQEYDIFLCNGEDQLIEPTVLDGFPNFTVNWSTGQEGSSITATSESPTDIYFTGIDFCENEFNDSIRINIPTPFILGDDYDDLCLGVNTDQVVTGGSQPYIFLYNTDSLDNSGTTFTPLFPGLYEIQIIDQCGESGTVFIEAIACETVFPNVFSPNDDSKNDAYVIPGLQGFPGSDLFVYNRWGGLIYEGLNYQNSWRAEEVPDGTYYFILNRSDGETFNGDITILRK